MKEKKVVFSLKWPSSDFKKTGFFAFGLFLCIPLMMFVLDYAGFKSRDAWYCDEAWQEEYNENYPRVMMQGHHARIFGTECNVWTIGPRGAWGDVKGKTELNLKNLTPKEIIQKCWDLNISHIIIVPVDASLNIDTIKQMVKEGFLTELWSNKESGIFEVVSNEHGSF